MLLNMHNALVFVHIIKNNYALCTLKTLYIHLPFIG